MTFGKRTIADINVKGKTVLMRVDFNVPLENGAIADDRRIVLTLDSIRSVIRRGGRVVLASHLGRPAGLGPEPLLSLAPCADRLRELLPKTRITLAPDCVGDVVEGLVVDLDDGDVLLLENLRFHHGEQERDPGFAAQLAELGEIYCQESFGTAHRKDASMIAVPELMGQRGGPRVAGLLLRREIEQLTAAFENPGRPFLAVLGGAKVSDKLTAIENIAKRVDAILIGGAMAYTFLLGQGVSVGTSPVEQQFVSRSAQMLERLEKSGVKTLLPVDHVGARELSDQVKPEVFNHGIPDGRVGLDIGPRTVQQFSGIIANAKTIYWNGPMGVFERKPFENGTRTLAEVIAMHSRQHGATSIIGGGDSAAAVTRFGLSEDVTHISTGGGASLHLLEGHAFHSVELLDPACP